LFDGNGGFVVQPNALRAEDADATWSKERLILNSFLKPSLPNGGFFWRCNSIDLRVDGRIREPMLQESARQLKVGASILLAKQACSLWSDLPTDLVRRNAVNNRVFVLTRDLLASGVLRTIPAPVLSSWGKLLLDQARLADLRDRIAGAAALRPSLWSFARQKPKETAKGLLRAILYKRHVASDLLQLLEREPEKLFP
jgi:hypothetical protein